jgi:hypothetical protein
MFAVTTHRMESLGKPGHQQVSLTILLTLGFVWGAVERPRPARPKQAPGLAGNKSGAKRRDAHSEQATAG